MDFLCVSLEGNRLRVQPGHCGCSTNAKCFHFTAMKPSEVLKSSEASTALQHRTPRPPQQPAQISLPGTKRIEVHMDDKTWNVWVRGQYRAIEGSPLTWKVMGDTVSITRLPTPMFQRNSDVFGLLSQCLLASGDFAKRFEPFDVIGLTPVLQAAKLGFKLDDVQMADLRSHIPEEERKDAQGVEFSDAQLLAHLRGNRSRYADLFLEYEGVEMTLYK